MSLCKYIAMFQRNIVPSKCQ